MNQKASFGGVEFTIDRAYICVSEKDIGSMPVTKAKWMIAGSLKSYQILRRNPGKTVIAHASNGRQYAFTNAIASEKYTELPNGEIEFEITSDPDYVGFVA